MNSIISDNSVQVVCDCQQSGIVKIESDLAAPSEDLELMEEAALLEEEPAGEEGTTSEDSDAEKDGDKKKDSSSVFVLIASVV